MNLLPYSKIETRNLSILLYSARFIALAAAAVFVLGVALIVFNIVMNLSAPLPLEDDGSGLRVVVTHESYGMAFGGVAAIFISVLAFVFSGFCAAVVSWEHKTSLK